MKHFLFTVPLLVSLFLLAGLTPSAQAASPKVRSALAAAKEATKKQKEFQKRLSKLSAQEKQALKSSLKGSSKYGEDSDNDGLPNIYEDATQSNSCSADSDGDGTDDGEDSNEREVELKGLVVSFTDPVLVVDGKNFTIDSKTSFRGTDFDQTDLIADLCVKIKGRATLDTVFVVRIEVDDGCGDGGGDDGGVD